LLPPQEDSGAGEGSDVPATIPVITTEAEIKVNRRNRRRWLLGLGLLLFFLIGVKVYALRHGFLDVT
jgi:hypothetical protein